MSKHYTVYVIKRVVEDWESASTSLETGYSTREAAESEIRRLEAHDTTARRRRGAPAISYEIESIEVYP